MTDRKPSEQLHAMLTAVSLGQATVKTTTAQIARWIVLEIKRAFAEGRNRERAAIIARAQCFYEKHAPHERGLALAFLIDELASLPEVTPDDPREEAGNG